MCTKTVVKYEITSKPKFDQNVILLSNDYSVDSNIAVQKGVLFFIQHNHFFAYIYTKNPSNGYCMTNFSDVPARERF